MLRRSYLAGLPETLAKAQGLCARLAAGEPPDEPLEGLFLIFHSIKGTAASFRLNDLGTAAAEAESLARSLRQAPSDAMAAALVALVDRLEDCRAAAAADDADEASEPAETQVMDTTPPPVPAGDRRRLYICDDERVLGEQLEAQLSCFGYAVSVFDDLDTLRAAVLASPPDAVIMDLVFPDERCGAQVVTDLGRECAVLPPVVFMSNERGFDWRLKAVQAGGQAYFVKPIKVTDLVDTLDVLTNRYEPEPYRVLVIDDEPTIARYHAAILQQAGMTTRLLHDPFDVLEELNSFKPDLVLLDMYMPSCNGRELSRLIRQIPEFVSLPIVFLSSETDKAKQASALRVGAEGFLVKPIQPDDLISAVAIRAERMRTLRSLMVRDSLTGLFNHTYLSQYLETALATARRTATPLCFVMIDVDYFKKVNDTYGHPAGDQVLVALARVLQQRLRHSDTVGRYGGEEFAVVMQNVGVAEARRIVDGIREDFSRISFRAGAATFRCSFSAGVAGFPPVGRAEALTEAADRALYDAKHAGRNRVVTAAAAMMP